MHAPCMLLVGVSGVGIYAASMRSSAAIVVVDPGVVTVAVGAAAIDDAVGDVSYTCIAHAHPANHLPWVEARVASRLG